MNAPAEPSRDEHIAEMYGQSVEERRRSRTLFSIAAARYLSGDHIAADRAGAAYFESLASAPEAAKART